MQSFVFKEMNKTSRLKDVNKIKFYGPLASALSFAVHCGNKEQTGLKETFKVYRGLQVPASELTHKYFNGNSIHLQGFTSTTLNRDTALNFALDNLPDDVSGADKCPLLIEIVIKGDK